MKKYIFITFDIQNMGGVQCYLSAKAKYLESIGWDVKVLYGGLNKHRGTLFPNLRKYLDCRLVGLYVTPYDLPKRFRDITINKCINIIGDTIGCEEVIIESGNALQAYWGEILASKIGAKHVFVAMNEKYRGKGTNYEAILDFFVFKFKRGEVLGSKEFLKKLYVGTSLEDFPFETNFLIDEAPIADIENELVNSLEKKDWNICYLGRANKTYVDVVIKEVAKFAKAHQSKSIQFVIVGKFKSKKEILLHEMQSLENVTLTLLGEMAPIPKSLYSKIDVLIAGSGSARHSVYEGKPVIVPDCYSCKSMGIFGYQTMQSLCEEDTSKQVDISVSLEDVLVKRIHHDMPFIAPLKISPEICTMDNFKQIAKSEQRKEYYPILEKSGGRKSWYGFLRPYTLEFLDKYCSLFYKLLLRYN